MKLTELSLNDFLSEVDSKKPAPGGGSVSSLASSLGVALSRMVGHLTISKKSFAKLDPLVQTEFQKKMDFLLEQKKGLVELIDADTAAFNKMMDAFRMPKDTEEEIHSRNLAIEEATIGGIEVPRAVAIRSLSCLKELSFFAENGNRSALSDVGVGALLLASGIEGAVMNMKINIPGLSNPEMKKHYIEEIGSIMKEMLDLREHLLNQIHSNLDQAMI